MRPDGHHGELTADYAVFSGQPCHTLDALDTQGISSTQPIEFIAVVGMMSGAGRSRSTHSRGRNVQKDYRSLQRNSGS
jgi:hypothetical protein